MLPQELVAAPWGAVCLAVLVQRCADKSAAVRARAMQSLAGVVAAWTSFNGGNSREEVGGRRGTRLAVRPVLALATSCSSRHAPVPCLAAGR